MSFYNLNGSVTEVKGLDDSYMHTVLRIPNWPTAKAAQAHPYHLNAAQDAGVLAMGIGTGAASGSVNVTPGLGSAGADSRAVADGQATANLGHDVAKGFTLAWSGAKHFLLRLAEGVVGVAFLIIGLNALLHNPIGKAVKAAPKVVPI